MEVHGILRYQSIAMKGLFTNIYIHIFDYQNSGLTGL